MLRPGCATRQNNTATIRLSIHRLRDSILDSYRTDRPPEGGAYSLTPAHGERFAKSISTDVSRRIDGFQRL